MISVFKKFKAWWMPVAKKIGEFQTKVILSIIYFLVIGPISLIAYIIRADMLKKRRHDKPSFWIKEQPPLNTLEGCQKQF